VKEVSSFQVRPLYLQVRDALLDRIKKGMLRPGGILPSEIDLHRELGVSLGTLRKALGVLEAEKIIVREPGRGTFVRGRQPGNAPSRFNPIRAADGAAIVGEVKTGKVKLGSARDQERVALRLEAGEQIARFHRVRFVGQRPYAYELVCLPDKRFPGFAVRQEIPSELEELAQAWGVLVARTEGKVRTVPAPAAAAAALSLNEGEAVLSLERLAFDTDDHPIEMMTAYFDLRDAYCQLDMR
jgi:GntR family transcriptional regulator